MSTIVTITRSTSLCTDTNKKYTGCHLEHTAAAWDHARDLKKYAALATRENAAVTIHAMMTLLMTLLMIVSGASFVFGLSGLHVECSKYLRTASRHDKQATTMACAAKTTRNDGIAAT